MSLLAASAYGDEEGLGAAEVAALVAEADLLLRQAVGLKGQILKIRSDPAAGAMDHPLLAAAAGGAGGAGEAARGGENEGGATAAGGGAARRHPRPADAQFGDHGLQLLLHDKVLSSHSAALQLLPP
jgi:hypothetical protein